MKSKAKRTILAALAGLVVIAMSGDKSTAATYGHDAYVGFGYTENACTRGLYPIYGYGGYVGPYYRNGCFGTPYDCRSVQIHCASGRHLRRPTYDR